MSEEDLQRMLIWWRTLAHPRVFQGPLCPHARTRSAVRMCCICSTIWAVNKGRCAPSVVAWHESFSLSARGCAHFVRWPCVSPSLDFIAPPLVTAPPLRSMGIYRRRTRKLKRAMTTSNPKECASLFNVCVHECMHALCVCLCP
jgi:hypothetical protein